MSINKRCLILLKGHPGVGKSTIAKDIASLLRCPLVDKDTARECLGSLSSSIPGSELNIISYDIMFGYVAAQLSLGSIVVCDSPLSRIELFHRALSICHDNSADIVLIEVECLNESTWRHRLESRGQDQPYSHKPKTWDELQSLISGYQGAHHWSNSIKEDKVGGVPCRLLKVDTSDQDSVDQLMQALQQSLAHNS